MLWQLRLAPYPSDTLRREAPKSARTVTGVLRSQIGRRVNRALHVPTERRNSGALENTRPEGGTAASAGGCPHDAPPQG